MTSRKNYSGNNNYGEVMISKNINIYAKYWISEMNAESPSQAWHKLLQLH